MTKTTAQLALIVSAAALLAQRLPWAKYDDDNPDDRFSQIKVDGPAAYAAWHAALRERYKGEKFAQLLNVQPDKLDQYWLEVIAQCIKLDVALACAGTGLDPRTSGDVLQIHVSRAEGFSQAGKSKGRGAEAASKGFEARAHFANVRGKANLAAAVQAAG